jgi:hypothetical protein
MNIDPVTVNADPIETKLSFKATNDSVGGSLAEMASLSSGGKLSLSGGLVLPTTGGTATPLGYYEEYTFSTTFSGPFTSVLNAIKVVRIGNLVTMHSPLFNTKPSGSATYFTSTAALPVRFRPAVLTLGSGQSLDNSVWYASCIGVQSTGFIEIYKGVIGSTFVSTGPAGFHAFGMSWTV